MTPGGALEASIVVVVPPGAAAGGCLDAVRRHTPEPHEVVVVAVGGDPARPDGSDPAAARVVHLPGPVPFGAAADHGASLARGRVVCFLDPAARVTDGWLAPLVAAATGGGAVAGAAMAVPLVTSPDERVVEAGSVLHRDGTVEAVGGGEPARALDHRFARRTDGGSGTCTCVRRSAFVAAGGFDANLDDQAAAGADLAAVLCRSGPGAVYEPASCVVRAGRGFEGRPLVAGPSPDGRLLAGRWGGSVPAGRPSPAAGRHPHHAAAARDAASPERILVVARSVPRATGPTAERRVVELLDGLAALRPGARLTLLAADGHDAGRRAPALLARGVEVAAGPADRADWFDRHLLLFSHVVVTDLRGGGGIGGHVARTQPQAQRVLYLPSLDFRDAASLEPTITSPLESDGFRQVVRLLEARLARRAPDFDALWCASRRDREWLAGVVPGAPCTVLPLAARPGGATGPAGRCGYVVLGGWGADVVAGHEDAAVYAAREVLPALLARDPSAVLRIVADEPSPGLQRMRGDHVEIVAAGDDPARWFRRARVCLAPYPHGSGAGEAVALALDTGTPFVTDDASALDGDLDHLGALVVAGGASAVAARAARLHADPGAWHDLHGALVGVVTGPRSRTATRAALVRAAAGVGIAPDPAAPPDEPPPPPADDGEAPAWSPRRVPLLGTATPRSADDDEHPPDEQYRRWRERFGPTPARLADVAGRLAALGHRPVVSIVMPVFDTEPAWLDAAIASVRTQLYDRWELCIGDDGSTRADTSAVLEAHRRDEPRIRVVHLPESQGIVGASNAALALATGDYVGFLDHDDLLKPHALAEVVLHLDRDPDADLVYTDEDKLEADGRLVEPYFKPDWSPDHLMSRNYVCHLLVLRRTLVDKLGGFRAGYDGSQDYDLVLRATEATARIAHLPEPLYTWRKVEGSTAAVADAKPWALDAARRALADALDRRGTPGEVVDGLHPTTYRARYAVHGRPKVSVIVPTRDRVDLLRRCIDSVVDRSTYRDFELLVVDNQSADPGTLAYLATLPGRVVRYPHRFNYARMMNLACAEAEGDFLLLLNNDTQVITPGWMEALLEHAQRPDVGIAGPRLRYPTGRPQHEGIITGYAGGSAGNVDHGGWWGHGDVVRNCTAVTGACTMIRPSVYWAVGGHDERLRIAFNDVDLCLRIRQAGYDVVYTPFAELQHVEGGTRGIHAHVDDDEMFEGRWATTDCVDGFYSPQLCRRWPFRIRS